MSLLETYIETWRRAQYRWPVLQMPIPTFAYSHEPKTFFGVLPGDGGPRIRTARMIESFGNHWFGPNILYANSAGGLSPSAIHAFKKVQPGARAILNQNGLYYRAWYKGDWKLKNHFFAELAELSDFIIFQSDFCVRAYEEIIGKISKPFEVIRNCSPDLREHTGTSEMGSGRIEAVPASAATSSKKTFLLSGIFAHDAAHILGPALTAFENLSDDYVLLLSGKFTVDAQESTWYENMIPRMDKLIRRGQLKMLGHVAPEALTAEGPIMGSLHLKYKDPCPNAVVERMSLGIPHIYSRSGGTPELVGESGIGLEVLESWDQMQSVDVDDLISAIKKLAHESENFSKAARARYEKYFTWASYVEAHKRIFQNVLNGSVKEKLKVSK